MDKYEYKVRADEIKSLVAAKKYADAMKIADTIDWRRVKSVMMLTIVSDVYKVNRRYDDSKEALLLAYERHPEGRTILYSLCELSIKMEEFVQAVEYYKNFVQIAPKDTSRYILQYKLYEAQEVSLEERISVLEEFKKRDYREKWAYELAYLYHRIGLSTKCVEECDELVLWFGEGKYVSKAMELKMLHEPLSPLQQEKFDHLNGNKRTADTFEDDDDEDMNIQVKTMDVGKYNTINLQKELAENMKELMEKTDTEEDADDYTKAIIAPLFQETGDMHLSKLHKAPPQPTKIEEVFFEEAEEEEDEDREEDFVVPELDRQITFFPKEMRQTKKEIEANKEFERMLSQEYDGQISLVVSEHTQLEKQITGQLKIEDILAEWEKTKNENKEKRLEDVRRKVLEQTGQLFSEFDEATKSDLLAKLEEASKIEEENRILKEAALQTFPPIAETEGATEETKHAEEAEKIVETKHAVETEHDEEAEQAVETEQALETEQAEENAKVEEARSLSKEEETLFGPLLHSKRAKRELLETLDAVSLAPCTGNIIITGEVGTGTIDIAKNLIREIQMSDDNFSGKVAKVTGSSLNGKSIAATLAKLENGALIVEGAGNLTATTVHKLTKVLDQSSKGIIILLEDTPTEIEKLLLENKSLETNFNARINVPHLNNDALVIYAKEYALQEEYTIDDLGVLALYTRIAEMQTSDHTVNIGDVEEIIEDAIYHANRKTIPHFMDILFSKRYDMEDMIILRENDFINY